MTVRNSYITRNKANMGGGIWVTSTAKAALFNLSVGHNTAGSSGGIQINYSAQDN